MSKVAGSRGGRVGERCRRVATHHRQTPETAGGQGTGGPGAANAARFCADQAAGSLARDLVCSFYCGNGRTLAAAVALSLLQTAALLAVSVTGAWAIDLVSGQGGTSFAATLAVCAASLVAYVALIYAKRLATSRFMQRAVTGYREAAFERLLSKGIGALEREGASGYVSGLTNDVTAIEGGYLAWVTAIAQDAIMLAGAVALMLWYSVPLTLVTAVLVAVPIATSALGGGRLAARETEVSARNASFVASLKDLLGGFPLVKSFGAEGPAARQFAASNRELEGAKRARSLAQGAILALAMFGRLFTKHGAMLAGAWMAVSGVGGITAGTVVFFVYAMDYVAQPIEDLPQAIAGRRAMRALVARMAGALASNAQAPGAPEVPACLRRGISLRDVGFAYPGGARVLDGVSAEIPAGSAWAVVGASGSGKSTLLSLLMGASGAYDGSIALDGVEVREASPASLYRAVCLVSQDVFLFDATLRDNVTMFGEADDASLMRAVGRAGLGAFVGEHGLDAPCGQGGRNLSGGERQRVAIARGLLRDAGTLLLDEATSALDARTAGQVMDSILSLGGVTRLVVTHRLAADELARFDGILVLRDGRVEEAGTFEGLMAARGYFYALYTVGQGA